MSSKKNLLLLFIIFTITAAAVPIHAEIINASKLEQAEKEKGKKEFNIVRDIFSPFKREFNLNPAAPAQPPPEVIQKPPEEENRVKERDVAGEVRRRVAYEGYVMREAKKLALLTVDSEFFVVGIDDTVKETIKIVNVEKKFVTLEVETNLVEINIKGDQDNEIQ
ncbi:MAG: hypothetical protein NT166_18995 [Candidatus Aminicenantes bacterium]|nr:hypothetical protein [Candidatus Aminicenantes bacterium]